MDKSSIDLSYFGNDELIDSLSEEEFNLLNKLFDRFKIFEDETLNIYKTDSSGIESHLLSCGKKETIEKILSFVVENQMQNNNEELLKDPYYIYDEKSSNNIDNLIATVSNDYTHGRTMF